MARANLNLELLAHIAPGLSFGDIVIIEHPNGTKTYYKWQKRCIHCLMQTEPEEHRQKVCRKCLETMFH